MSASVALYSTIVTPYDERGAIDYDALGRLIDLLAQCHCDGVFAVCQSSEMFFLTQEEKLELAQFCVRRCRERGMGCVVSGHTEDDPEAQLAFLRRMEEVGADGLVLVSNRLAGPEEDDERLLERLSRLMEGLRPETRLGIYECPYPYKRLLSARVLRVLAASGRFDFIKDTCCDSALIRERLALLAGSPVRLFNANIATLVRSVADGAAGYSGVVLNFFPEHFGVLKDLLTPPATAGKPTRYDLRAGQGLGEFLTTAGVYELQNYPANAKHVLVERGLFRTAHTRTGQPPLTGPQMLALAALRNQAARVLAAYGPGVRQEWLLPAGEHFHNCHGSTVLPLADGTVLAACFAGTREGHPDVGIWLARRVNGVWQEPACIAKTEPVAHWNPVLFPVAEGVRLVYKVGPDVPHWHTRTMLSRDGGVTWLEERACAAPNEAAGPVRGKPLRLPDGRLLAPCSVETAEAWLPRVDVSEDEGATFRPLAQVPLNLSDPAAPDWLEGLGAIQPALWASGPECIHMLLRTTAGFLFRSDSADGGRTWCRAYRTGLPSNNSAIDVATHGGDVYLVWNPISGNWAARNPLVVWRSRDNGQTFLPFRTLESEAYDSEGCCDAEFSYPAMVAAGCCLHITYTHHRRRIAYCAIPLGE